MAELIVQPVKSRLSVSVLTRAGTNHNRYTYRLTILRVQTLLYTLPCVIHRWHWLSVVHS